MGGFDKKPLHIAARTILLREIVVFLLRKMSTILKKATIFFWPVHGDLRPPIRNIGKGRLTAFSHQKPQILDFSPREVQVHGLWGTHFPCFIVISSLNNRAALGGKTCSGRWGLCRGANLSPPEKSTHGTAHAPGRSPPVRSRFPTPPARLRVRLTNDLKFLLWWGAVTNTLILSPPPVGTHFQTTHRLHCNPRRSQLQWSACPLHEHSTRCDELSRWR